MAVNNKMPTEIIVFMGTTDYIFKNRIDKSNKNFNVSKRLEFFTIPKKNGTSSKVLKQNTTFA